jgi:hypothetical protein
VLAYKVIRFVNSFWQKERKRNTNGNVNDDGGVFSNVGFSTLTFSPQYLITRVERKLDEVKN